MMQKFLPFVALVALVALLGGVSQAQRKISLGLDVPELFDLMKMCAGEGYGGVGITRAQLAIDEGWASFDDECSRYLAKVMDQGDASSCPVDGMPDPDACTAYLLDRWADRLHRALESGAKKLRADQPQERKPTEPGTRPTPDNGRG